MYAKKILLSLLLQKKTFAELLYLYDCFRALLTKQKRAKAKDFFGGAGNRENFRGFQSFLKDFALRPSLGGGGRWCMP